MFAVGKMIDLVAVPADGRYVFGADGLTPTSVVGGRYWVGVGVGSKSFFNQPSTVLSPPNTSQSIKMPTRSSNVGLAPDAVYVCDDRRLLVLKYTLTMP